MRTFYLYVHLFYLGQEVNLELNLVSSERPKQGKGGHGPPPHSPELISPVEEQMLHEVLDTRPTLRLGRAMSVRYRSNSAFLRGGRGRHSSSSLPRVGSAFQRGTGDSGYSAGRGAGEGCVWGL